jgi:putative FmdB family regulatory protein
MPVYAFQRSVCGDFESIAPVAQFDQPQPCPDCADLSPRALLSASMLAMMGSAQRNAFAINERSANAPETLRRSGRHPASCGCCRPVVPNASVKKSFPGKCPWMIVH